MRLAPVASANDFAYHARADTPAAPLGPPPMRHVAFCLGLIALAATFAAPPAQAQKNEGMGVLGPTGSAAGSGRRQQAAARRGSGGAPRAAIPASRPIPAGSLRSTARSAPTGRCCARTSASRCCSSYPEQEDRGRQAGRVVAAHDAWLDSRKPCAEKDKDTAIVACLTPLYDARVRELEKLTGGRAPQPRRAQ